MYDKLEHIEPIPEPSVTGDTIFTPRDDETIAGHDTWDGRVHAIPWPGSTFIIVEHGTNRAITITKSGAICLQGIDDNLVSSNNRWLCVEKRGYFGFYSAESRRYLGHNGPGHRIVAEGPAHRNWELITARKHPEGGYQLLFPYFEHTLMMLTVADGGKKLVRTQHGDSKWDFIKVERA